MEALATCGATSPAALHPHAEALLAAMLPVLAHQHSRVRAAALGALHSLVTQGAVPREMLEQRVVPAVAALALDHVPQLRASLFCCAAQWLGGGQAGDGASWRAQQAAALLPPLLPTLLLGLTDAEDATRTSARQQLEDVAAAHAAGLRVGAQAAAPHASLHNPFDSTLPTPEVHSLARAHLQHLLPAALASLSDWTAEQRRAAVRVLHVVLILAGDAVLPELPRVLSALHAVVAEDDLTTALHAVASGAWRRVPRATVQSAAGWHMRTDVLPPPPPCLLPLQPTCLASRS